MVQLQSFNHSTQLFLYGNYSYFRILFFLASFLWLMNWRREELCAIATIVTTTLQTQACHTYPQLLGSERLKQLWMMFNWPGEALCCALTRKATDPTMPLHEKTRDASKDHESHLENDEFLQRKLLSRTCVQEKILPSWKKKEKTTIVWALFILITWPRIHSTLQGTDNKLIEVKLWILCQILVKF